jgi:hypothetical protein
VVLCKHLYAVYPDVILFIDMGSLPSSSILLIGLLLA